MTDITKHQKLRCPTSHDSKGCACPPQLVGSLGYLLRTCRIYMVPFLLLLLRMSMSLHFYAFPLEQNNTLFIVPYALGLLCIGFATRMIAGLLLIMGGVLITMDLVPLTLGDQWFFLLSLTLLILLGPGRFSLDTFVKAWWYKRQGG